MQPTLQALASLQNALREALVQQDWAAIGTLDAQCRALIEEAGASDPALREPLEALSRLYAELQQAARAERERIAGELTRLNQSKRVDQAYKTFG
ncbi:flagellar protein FliT [Stutzerimonas stutzeri]|uniref:Flagellar protein FliT n=1 Tax=Stutzerimonas stutzeri TaxID=316 RepID=A0A2N8T517_STUST|nr:flagellar protein FliT [Stutzerimonas stutzeri]MCQ4326876.1 flagellar protein FliT [Stutzerimonas stutzeri]PNG09813.1 flagellar protein FliT [Stutzerimonas stutzeri]